jgi:hypothetical protein
LLKAFPNFREKLEAEFAKMTPERREWIKCNQALIFAKLHQRQMELAQKSTSSVRFTVGKLNCDQI